MNDFERLYYENDSFWAGNALQDSANIERIKYTTGLVPGDVRSLVDVGCGNGIFLNYLATSRNDVRMLGLDRSEKALSHVKGQKLQADISDTKLEDSSFDCVTCLEVIEHLPIAVYQSAITELARIAKKYIIVSVPYNENLEESANQCPSCKTIFNCELHLRNFDDHKMVELFKDARFTCKSIDHLGASKKLKFHYQYRKLFYPEQFRKFRSPICPLCGYTRMNEIGSITPRSEMSQDRKLNLKKRVFSAISAFPKTVWPKEVKYYWVIALYERMP